MAKISIVKTTLSGFGVIGRQPLAPLVWGLVALVLSIVPMLLVLPVMMEFFNMAITGVRDNLDPDSAEMRRISSQLNAVSPLSWITGLLSYSVTTGALFRAMLRPQDKAWFFMRVGLAEVMLVAVTIVFVILFVMACLVVSAVVAIAAVIAWQASEGAGITTAVVLGLVALGVLIWGGVRFSLAFAMSWDQKQFLLFESWTLTKGHGLRLVLVALLNFIVVLLLSLLIGAVLIGGGLGVMAATGVFETLRNVDPETYFTPERILSLWPVALVWIFLATMIQSYVTVIQTAPWAEAYRELVAPGEEVV